MQPKCTQEGPDGQTLYRCTTCKEWKDATHYTALRTLPRGVSYNCVACCAVLGRATRARNREAARERERRRWATMTEEQRARKRAAERARYAAHREAILARNRVYWQGRKEWKRAYATRRPKRDTAYMRAYQEANRERLNANKRAYNRTPRGRVVRARISHKRRAVVLGTPCTLTVHEWLFILRVQDHRCAKCGQPFTDELRPSCDHVVPVAAGGSLTYDNCQALCSPCNASKGSAAVWYRPQVPYSDDTMTGEDR